MDPADYVPRGFSSTERAVLPFTLDTAADAVESLVGGGLLATQQRFHPLIGVGLPRPAAVRRAVARRAAALSRRSEIGPIHSNFVVYHTDSSPSFWAIGPGAGSP